MKGQPLSHVQLFATPWTVAHQAPLSVGFSRQECQSGLPLPSPGSFQMSQFFASGGPKYWSFSFNISLSNEYSGLISFRMDWLDLFAVQGTHESLLQHHSSKASILQRSAFFIVQLSHSYMTTGKSIALTRWTFAGKVMSLLFNMLSRLVIAFLPRIMFLLVSWLQLLSAVIGCLCMDTQVACIS